ncbi:hypothetical protein ACWC5I_38725 [Kitasatospora sp. NPDC001574]
MSLIRPRWTWAITASSSRHTALAPGALPESTARALAEAWTAALDGLATWAGTAGSGGHTPSDLDLLSLDQDQIAMLEQMWKDQR